MNLEQLKLTQQQLAEQVNLTDDFNSSITLIGGTDVGFEDEGKTTRAAIVILTYPDFDVVEYHVARLKTEFPYIPGYLSFREYPALLSAWEQVEHKPDLLLVDGQGVAHPRRLGIASHLGLLLDMPTIGVAKKRLCGHYNPLPKVAGQVTPLTDKQQQIGWVLQSKNNCNPLFISSGHRISQASALNWVNLCLRGYRLPEPTRWADAVASNKPLFKKFIHAK
ncbi:deoxyribonuclease V [Gilliamella sp. B3825]|nr:deoxyribonuclease V [Gilliamella sp. B3831]MCX8577094.1 deoxyribonuclease V [Gilliamella sp. B3815]MCX8589644.1 deoxyribonuclease V [Gilliamella sp. B3812]MCX8604140.1 deoxyribonuclease V [Gilliamella sp. B3823]MCX8605538.1 deoxyribonuclease V [Gilliamella sp. B3825]MCX8637712.1 deoxyribonuclease V [Gilliamella sp. B3817]